jgi:hypothetical protein
MSIKTKLLIIPFFCAMAGAAIALQDSADSLMIAAIKAEGQSRSQAPAMFRHLTDVVGPRLSGSPAHTAAAKWAVERFQQWGLANARLDPFPFGRGWTLEKQTLEMTAPRYMPLTGYAQAWSPSTAGVLSGTPIYLGDSTPADIDRMGSRLRGAIVLLNQPQTEFLRSDRQQPSVGVGPVQTGNPRFPSPSSVVPTAELLTRLRTLGAGVALMPSATEHGTVRVEGNRNNAADAVPTVVLAAEHYNMLVRLAQSGAPVNVRVEVGARFQEADLNSYNVLAELPGVDPALKDEVVFIGAHLDSWHTATGATDNADGAVAVIEAMRILAAVKSRPRRTIRAALWSGEEQRMLGSAAYVDRYLRDQDARNRVSVYLNDDPGSGPSYGFYMQNNDAAKRIFDAWLEPLRDLGVRRNIIEGIGSTDHLPFDDLGIPAFTVIKDFTNYDVRTRHTNADLSDAVKGEDLRQSAVFFALTAWQAAMRDDRIPRR